MLIFALLFPQIVLYLRTCLSYSAGATPTTQSLMDMQDDAPLIGRYVQSLLSNDASPSSANKGGEVNPVHVYIDLLQQLLSAVGGEEDYKLWFLIGVGSMKIYILWEYISGGGDFFAVYSPKQKTIVPNKIIKFNQIY